MSEIAPNPISFGIKPGLTEPFFIDQATRDRLVREHPACAPLLRKMLRGRNVERWHPSWDGEWIILLKSSEYEPWPWTAARADEAERIVARTYPSLHRHIKPRQADLAKCQDRGRHWWALVERLRDLAGERQECRRRFVEALAASFGIEKPSRKLEEFWRLDDAAIAEQVRRESPLRALASALSIQGILGDVVSRARAIGAELAALEFDVPERVFALYELTTADVELLTRTAPPPDPLAIVRAEAAALALSGSLDRLPQDISDASIGAPTRSAYGS